MSLVPRRPLLLLPSSKLLAAGACVRRLDTWSRLSIEETGANEGIESDNVKHISMNMLMSNTPTRHFFMCFREK